MADNALGLLTDILHAGKIIESYVAGLSRYEFLADQSRQDAVLWRFAVLGEACRRLQRRHPESAARISELKDAIAYRNFLIHVYDAIDPKLVWGTIEGSLPALLAEIEIEIDDLGGLLDP